MSDSKIERLIKSNPTRRYLAVVFLAAIGMLLVSNYWNTVPAEDAIMLFGYAKNLATEGIITYGHGTSVPVEGATDFLYMLLISAFSALGVEEFASSLILNYLGIILICYIFYRQTRSIFTALVAILLTPYFYASMLGFSAMLFSALYVLCLHLNLQGDRRLYLASLVLCLIRPDGVLWCAGTIATRLLALDKKHVLLDLKCLFGYLILPGIAYFGWRLWYFQEFLPIPFTVKATGERYFFPDTLDAIFPMIVPAVVVVLYSGDRWRVCRKLLVLFACPIIFYSSIRLEQNVGNRYLSPMFFGMLLLLEKQNEKRLTATFVFLSICLTFQTTWSTVSEIFRTKSETSRSIGQTMRNLPRGKLLSTEAGKLAFYSSWVADDSWGLNTPKFAHRLITGTDVAEGAYDLIAAHCGINLLRVRAENTSGDRTWLNQCRSLAQFLSASNYEIILVPLYKASSWLPATFDDSACAEHLIYGISPKYPAHEQLKESLLSFRGIPFDKARGFYVEDTVCRKR